MFQCASCDAEFRDGVQCSVCECRYDFPCAGITEVGYRKLGDRRQTWKCTSCKGTSVANPVHPAAAGPKLKSPKPADMESIAMELKLMTSQMASLPTLAASVKAIQDDIASVKASVDFVHNSMETLSTRISEVNQEVQGLLKTKDDLHLLQKRFEDLENRVRESEQRSRMNNIEVKGVPVTPSENLFEIVGKLCHHIGLSIPKEQINNISRIPMRNDKLNKTIIISVHNRYIKEDFVAAAKKFNIVPADLGLKGDTKIFINDHLTLENKILLNKAKNLARERGFAFVWVKGCKIFVRKTPTTPALTIKSELDLKKLT